MKEYNLRQLVLISVYDFYESNDYHYLYKSNAEPIRNLFRKKENKKYIQGWYSACLFTETIYYMNPDDIPSKIHIIKDGKCYVKPSIVLKFNSGIIFEKYFETFNEAKAFSEHIKLLAKSDTEYIAQL